jgi:hypothetical protein
MGTVLIWIVLPAVILGGVIWWTRSDRFRRRYGTAQRRSLFAGLSARERASNAGAVIGERSQPFMDWLRAGGPFRARLAGAQQPPGEKPSARPAQRTAPPAPHPQDDGHGHAPVAGSRFAPFGDLPQPFAAAQQFIAGYEPEGDGDHAAFMTSLGRFATGIGEAIDTYADSLIHGPGLSPSSLRGTFDLADGFGEVALQTNHALKTFYDYHAGHLDWVESGGEAPRDGRWFGRDR